MSFTLGEVVADVREIIQDSEVPYRYSDAFILRKANQVLKRMVIVRPDLFSTISSMACAIGNLQQGPSDCVRIMDVIANSDGHAVKEISQEVLDLTYPSWADQAAAPATDWMRYVRDPNRFFVFPPATNSYNLTIVYAKCPPNYAQSDVVALQDAYYPTVVDGTVWMMEAVDAEHVDSGRAKMYRDSFDNALNASLSARTIADSDSSGEQGVLE